MNFLKKTKSVNGKRTWYFCGIKIFSYHKKSDKRNKNFLTHKVYGKIYYPFYNTNCSLASKQPEIYNKKGQKMEFFFIRDAYGAHAPYQNYSQYFLWDRYNIGLNTHFYTHKSILETMGKPTRKYALFIESPAIVPADFEIFNQEPALSKDFESIFTIDEKILNKFSNAKFFPGCAGFGLWVKKEDILDNRYQYKNKNISIVSSDKEMCFLHKLRIDCAQQCKKFNLADTFGTFDGGSHVNIIDTLKNYRFSIVFENDIRDFWFTEKITNCFVTQTIPVYYGAQKIDKFFNPDGIIILKKDDLFHIEDVLKQCTSQEYERRLPAVIDNYHRVYEYENMDDWLYEHYFIK